MPEARQRIETCVEFRSDRFPPYEGEEEQINPDCWGKRLAEFLRDGLRAKGFVTEEPCAEDWGWVLPVLNDQFRLWIDVGHHQEYPDGFACFINPHRPFVRRFFKKIETRETVTRLKDAIDKILNDEAGVREKRWWTDEEFNCVPNRKAGG
jgi:hypothetical protein